MALSKKHVSDVCFEGGGHLQCRYLDEDFDDDENIVHICKKLSTDRSVIDHEVVEFFNDMKKSGGDPAKQGVPLGDNCPGYIAFKTKPQGYDVKP